MSGLAGVDDLKAGNGAWEDLWVGLGIALDEIQWSHQTMGDTAGEDTTGSAGSEVLLAVKLNLLLNNQESYQTCTSVCVVSVVVFFPFGRCGGSKWGEATRLNAAFESNQGDTRRR